MMNASLDAGAAPRPLPSASPLPAELFALAVRHHLAGRPEEAECLYGFIVTLEPAHAEAWSNLGFALSARRAFAEAAEACRRAIALRPAYADAHLNLIGALEGLGARDAVGAALRDTIALLPDRPDLRVRLEAHEAMARAGAAPAPHPHAGALAPASALALFDQGRRLTNSGRPEEAAAAYAAAIAAFPDFPEALSNLGTVLGGLGRYDEAVAAGGRAFALAPRSGEIAMNFGVVLQQRGDVREAVEAYERALAIDPANAGALANLGIAYQELFRFDDAMDAFERAIAARPDFHTAIIERIKLRRHVCDWHHYDEDQRQLETFLERGQDVIFMLLFMGFQNDPRQQLDCARLHMRRLNAAARRAEPRPRRAGGRIRVGYLSADYRDHPVGRLLPALFGRHDRARFEIVGYALGSDDPGELRRRIVASLDAFVDLHALSNADAARRIEADAVDILVDLTGPTIGSRLEILAARPAPVQVSFLGWPGTMGADFIDYVVGDPFLIPAGQQPFYTERIVHLPDGYQPSDPARRPSEPPPSRADCDLPDDGFVFCSFNNTVKLTPAMFDLWMRLLARVEGSVLWLYCKTPRTMENIRARAEARGIPGHRVVFAPVAPMDAYLARFPLADLFLDSFPYNAGATCNDALWMGLPVLTRAGDTYVSRMAGSLLTTAGLPELVTTSPEAYESMAVRIATEPGLLDGLRRRLRENRDLGPLFDMARFTANLERAYARMHALRQAGDDPRGFVVVDPGEDPAGQNLVGAGGP